MIDLAERVALVTGGSRGIGAATAQLLARAGADVMLTYRTRAAEADAVAARIGADGRRALTVGGDLADAAVVDRLVEQVRAEFGRLDILVLNAGTWPAEPVLLGGLSPQRWRETLTTNLDAAFLTVRALLPLLSDGGTIVFVASTAAQRGEAFHADYAAAKGAIISLTKSLAIEYAPRLTVNCVAPGWVDTEMVAAIMTGDGRAAAEAGIPLGRLATAQDVAGPILFLCSPLARHITGEVLNVNGGSVLCG